MKIKITTSYYFEGFFNILGYVMIPIAIYLLFVNQYTIGLIVGYIAFVLLTSKYQLLIDPNEKYYKDYLWISGFEIGDKKSFHQLGVVSVKPEKYVQRISSFAYNKEMRFTVYAIYIFIDGEELYAGEYKEKPKADERAKELSAQLGTSCYV
jgi:hypothetical protein